MMKKNWSLELLWEEPSGRLIGRFKGPGQKKGGRDGWYFVYKSESFKRGIGARSCMHDWVGSSTSC